jgi:hypothetical protein
MVRVMLFNATFNDISVILWRSVLWVDETKVPRENHRLATSHCQTIHIMLHRVHLAWVGFKLTTLLVIGTHCICNCKSNYHMTMTTTAPYKSEKNWFNICLLSRQCQRIHINTISCLNKGQKIQMFIFN